MKKTLLLLLGIFTFGLLANAQCIVGFEYGTAALVDSNSVEIDACSFYGDYSTVTGALAGQTYEFDIAAGGYVTVYQDGVSTTLLGHGASPLTVTALTSGAMYAHWTADAACTTSSVCQITSVQWTSWTPPSCPAPTLLSSSLVSTTSAILSWTTGGASNWVIEYGPQGFTQGTGTLVSANSNPFTIAGLTASTSYSWYVRDSCGAANLSSESGPNTFYTGYCIPAPTSVDYSGITNVTMGTINNTTGSEPGNYGNYSNLIVNAGQSTILNISVSIEYGYGLWAWIDWNNDLDFNDANEFQFLGESPSVFGPPAGVLASSITVPLTASLGNHKIRIGGSDTGHGVGSSHDPCYSGSYGIFEDYTINVTPPPACIAPTALNNGVTTTTSSNFLWTTGGASNWVVEYGPTGFARGTGTIVSVTGNDSLFVSGLTANTAYQWYVRDYCGGTDSSTWVGPIALYTGYCVPVSSGTATYINNFTTSNAVVNISNLASGFTAGGYKDNFAIHSVTAQASTSFVFNTVVVGGSLGTAIWIDWNNNLAFETTERVFNTTSYGYNQTGSIAIPASTPVGNYRMRVLVDYNLSNPTNPCNSATRSEVEDYKLTVLAAPTCIAPTALSISNISATGVYLNWTTSGSTNWVVEYGPTGFAHGAGTVVSVSTFDSLNLAGLNSNTAYQWYVRGYCGGTDSSTWVGPNSFTTQCVAYTVPYFEGFESGYTNQTAVGGCLSQVSVIGAGVWTANNTLTTYNRAPRTGTFNSYLGYSNTDWIFIPITLNAGVSYTAQLYARQDYATTIDANMTISYGNSPTAAAMTNTIVGPIGINTTYQFISGVFTPATSGTFYVGIKGYMSGNPYYISLDDIAIDVTPACPGVPSALTSTVVSPYAVNLNWVTAGATNWVVEYGLAGFAHGAGTLVSVTGADSLNLTGLNAGTAYSWYVRDYCGGVDSSFWAGPNNFSTFITCPAPTAASSKVKSFTEVDLNWTTGGASNWIVQYGVSGFTPGAGTFVSVTGADSLNVAGLTPMTTYQWYVKDFCGVGDSSTWSGPFSFYTGYCTPAPSSVDNSGITNVTLGAINNTTVAEVGNYGNYTSLVAVAGQGTTLPISVTLGYNYGMWAWIDWNNDLDFDDAGEFIFLGESPSGNPSTVTGLITIPASASLGNHLVRIGGSDFSHGAASSHDPCYTGSWGSFEDYTLNVVSCNIPVTMLPVSFCDGDSLVLSSGLVLNAAGMYNDTLVSYAGCDSVLTYDVSILMPSSSTGDVVLCQGTPLTLPGGTMVYVGGTYNEVFVNAVGCDSTVTYTVTMNLATSSTTNIHLCDGDSYTLPSGTVVSTANTYLISETNSNGCDSTALFIVSTGLSTAETIDVSFCTGSSVTLADGSIVSAPGMVVVTTTNNDGCDNVITYNITENVVSTGTTAASICAGGSYMFDGQNLTTGGVYTMMATSANGCDSTVELTLTVLPVSSSTTNAAICAGDSYAFDGQSLTDAGTYTMTTLSANGCDSVATLNLVVNLPKSSAMQATICAGDSYAFDGQSLTDAGVYTANGLTAAGCDSIVTLTLTVDAVLDVASSATICRGDSYVFGTQILTEANVYTETMTNANGCSYTETLTLTVVNAVSTSVEVLLCGNQLDYTLANGTVVTTAGIYTATVASANGCDSTITYNVSTCVGISNVTNNVAMIAYPNPAKDKLNVKFEEKLSSENTIRILNVLGQSVYNVSNFNGLTLEVNTSNLTSGVYYINVTSDNKTSVVPFTVAK